MDEIGETRKIKREKGNKGKNNKEKEAVLKKKHWKESKIKER